MFLEEPKAEFVPINLRMTAQDASDVCPDWVTQTPVGGGQRCIGSQIDAKDCGDDWDIQDPWLD